jgi:hypothetical protein
MLPASLLIRVSEEELAQHHRNTKAASPPADA